jgi:ferric-dicitrate binding protein FerR (iron transport regulator)
MLSQANSVYATSVGTMHATVMEPSTAMAKLYLRYAKGLIDVNIENVPLEKVMRELMRYTGIQVSLTDRDIAQGPISASL